MTGYSDEELKGMTPAIHLGEEQFTRIAEQLAQSGRFRGEALSRRKSGETIHIDLSAFTMFDDDGRPLYHVGVKRDITERKRHEMQLRRRLNELEAIYRLTNTISRLGRLTEIYEEALSSLWLALQTDRGAILLFDEDGTLRVKASRGLSERYGELVETHPPQRGPTAAIWAWDL